MYHVSTQVNPLCSCSSVVSEDRKQVADLYTEIKKPSSSTQEQLQGYELEMLENDLYNS